MTDGGSSRERDRQAVPSAEDGFEAHRSRLFGLAYRLLGTLDQFLRREVG